MSYPAPTRRDHLRFCEIEGWNVVRLDVRRHTHLAEDADEDAFCEATFGCRPMGV